MRTFGLLACLIGLALPAAGQQPATSGSSSASDCQPVAGVEKLIGAKAPAYVLVGEPTETREGPAVFAEIACAMAKSLRRGKLLVGVTDYFGGATDAEVKMRARLDDLAASGAPIAVFSVDQIRNEDRHMRDRSEDDWAKAIEAKVSEAGATRALILLPRSDASLADVRESLRNAAYRPMPMHLPRGQVANLEIVQSLAASGIRFYSAPRAGFAGEIAFSELTRPQLEQAGGEKRDFVLVRVEIPDGASRVEELQLRRDAVVKACELSPEERSARSAALEAPNEAPNQASVQFSPAAVAPAAPRTRFFSVDCSVYRRGRTIAEGDVKAFPAGSAIVQPDQGIGLPIPEPLIVLPQFMSEGQSRPR